MNWDQKKYADMQERLLDSPYRVIDILPRQAPVAGGGCWFAVEQYLMEHPQIDGLYSRFARLMLKLSCYYGPVVYDPEGDVWIEAPEPAELVRRVAACASTGRDRYVHVLFPAEDALLTLEGDDVYMTLYAPEGELQETAAQLAAAEGLFLRRPADCRFT